MVFKILLIIHLLADFCLQNKNSVQKKDTEDLTFLNILHTEHLKHALIHAVIFIFFIVIITLPQYDYLSILLLTLTYFISHYFIDVVKTQLTRKWITYKIWLFYGDQLFHLGVLLVMNCVITNTLNITSILVEHELIINWLLAILLISKTANVIFQVTFEKFSPKSDIELIYCESNKGNETNIGFENAGALIGIMERLLIISMLAFGDVAAIAFVLGIKSIVRFEKLKEAKFGEYFLIGTLFSVLYTIIVYILIFRMEFL